MNYYVWSLDRLSDDRPGVLACNVSPKRTGVCTALLSPHQLLS